MLVTLSLPLLLLVGAQAAVTPPRTIPLTKAQQRSLTFDDGRANLDAVIAAASNTKSKFASVSRILQHNVEASTQAVAAGAAVALDPAWRNNTLTRLTRRQRTRTASTAVLPLTPYERDILWTGVISVGSPAQSLIVDFDTGSSDLVVIRSNCAGAGCNTTGDGTTRKQYNPSKSSTSTNTNIKFTNSYSGGSTSTSGEVFKDYVNLGRLRATQQAINAATSVGVSIANLYADGLFGLGFPALSSSGFPSLPFTLFNQGMIPANIFGFRLSSEPGVSELSMGFLNTAKFSGKIRYYPMIKDPYYADTFTYYQLGKSVSNVNGAPVPGSGGAFIIDTGTTLIVSPVAQARAFWAAVPGSAPYEDGYYTFPCNSPPAVSLSFSGAVFPHAIAAEDFNLGYIDNPNGRCIGALVGMNIGLGTRTIVGDVFIKSWYTAFDLTLNRVGFATPA